MTREMFHIENEEYEVQITNGNRRSYSSIMADDTHATLFMNRKCKACGKVAVQMVSIFVFGETLNLSFQCTVCDHIHLKYRDILPMK